MEGGDACADYSNSPLFSGTFTLLFTSSKTFHTNRGLMAYSRDVAGVSTPELRMKLTREAGNRLVVFEEPLERGSTPKLPWFAAARAANHPLQKPAPLLRAALRA
mgnify:CR=1 FL=1